MSHPPLGNEATVCAGIGTSPDGFACACDGDGKSGGDGDGESGASCRSEQTTRQPGGRCVGT